jgi:hypothetical protein
MALRLVKTTNEGFTVEYWRVDPMVSIDMVGRTASARILTYKDATARQTGKASVRVGLESELSIPNSVSLSGAALDAALVTGDVRAAMYGVLKTLSAFTGAEDV